MARPKSVDRVAVLFFREKGRNVREIAKLAMCSQSSVEKILANEKKTKAPRKASNDH